MDVKVNEDLLRSVMDHIETWPNLLDQQQWRNGTARDFAGWTAELTGATWLFDASDERNIEIDGRFDRANAFIVVPARFGTPRKVQHVQDYATEMLRLREHDADRLFADNATLSDLREMVSNLCDFGTTSDAAPKTQTEVTAL